ncbi:hypothetical protein PHSY_001336 [Pseudozyma hubeiensis SY62]|uniref:Secreted protein n=1 Tax=Pseudozyma hubeiensis (strain SY62) TaxID=1305764 RepID=R9NYL1_PSEHS|nr:hypothetical protein PHSY_001336 [Pseudozyma hubeiensis SY62]GAC93771.1 hypothetical protein PHSY_001336 [Pseudozyma hubeiensis SY62]
MARSPVEAVWLLIRFIASSLQAPKPHRNASPDFRWKPSLAMIPRAAENSRQNTSRQSCARLFALCERSLCSASGRRLLTGRLGQASRNTEEQLFAGARLDRSYSMLRRTRYRRRQSRIHGLVCQPHTLLSLPHFVFS